MRALNKRHIVRTLREQPLRAARKIPVQQRKPLFSTLVVALAAVTATIIVRRLKSRSPQS
jgi:hypothetical protein